MGDRQKGQDEVRNHTDDTESGQGQQHDQCGAKDKASLLHISLRKSSRALPTEKGA